MATTLTRPGVPEEMHPGELLTLFQCITGSIPMLGGFRSGGLGHARPIGRDSCVQWLLPLAHISMILDCFKKTLQAVRAGMRCNMYVIRSQLMRERPNNTFPQSEQWHISWQTGQISIEIVHFHGWQNPPEARPRFPACGLR